MTDVLLITGPMNATQLGVPKSASYRTVQVHPTGPDIGSTAYGNAMRAWLGGRTLRDRLRLVEPDLGKVGVAWFSAGHGAVKVLLNGAAQPSSAVAWMCLDGLYGSNDFAVQLVQAAKVGSTSLIATASTSTPGTYDHSLDRWRDVVAKTNLPAVSPGVATAWALPEPDQCWAQGKCLVAGYEDLGHHEQVPDVREGMLNWWEKQRFKEPPVPGPFPGDEEPEGDGAPWWVVVGAVAVGGLLGYGFDRLVNPRRK